MNCTSHHPACECREHKIAVLSKAAYDASLQINWLKDLPDISADEKAGMEGILDRLNAAREDVAITEEQVQP